MTPETITCYRCACGTVYQEAWNAVSCCTCPDCGTQTKGHTRCSPCRAEAERRSELARLRKATRIDPADYDGPADYAGPVCSDGLDKYHKTIQDWRDTQDGKPETWQPYLWPCRAETPQLDLDEILATAEEQCGVPDGWDEWCGVEALRTAIDAFNADQPRGTVWHADLTRVIVLDAARFDALIAEVQ